MEVMMLVRGEKMWSDEFINQLRGQYLPVKLKMKDGKVDENGTEQDMLFQVGVKPISLYMVSFPKEHKDLMLTTLLGKDQYAGRPEYKFFEKWFGLVRKFLGLSKISKYDASRTLPVLRANIDTLAIGIKEDKEHGFGEGL